MVSSAGLPVLDQHDRSPFEKQLRGRDASLVAHGNPLRAVKREIAGTGKASVKTSSPPSDTGPGQLVASVVRREQEAAAIKDSGT